MRKEYDFSYLPHAAQLASETAEHEGAAPRMTIVDCGANIGCSVTWFANKFPGAKIVAIEPDLANFVLLTHNVAQLANVHTVRAAVWSSDTRVMITNPEAEPWALRTMVATADRSVDEPINTITIDRILANHDPSTKLIVKIDIEGAEYEIFSNDTSWIKFADLIIVELHDNLFPWQGNSRPFFSTVAAYPMEYAWREENLFCFQMRMSIRPPNTRNLSAHRTPDAEGTNPPEPAGALDSARKPLFRMSFQPSFSRSKPNRISCSLPSYATLPG
jgi:FkbM family methyltransferase